MNLVSPDNNSSIEWTQGSIVSINQQPLIWYKVNSKTWTPKGVVFLTSSCTRNRECVVFVTSKAYFDSPSSLWPWTWEVWGRVEYGSVAEVSEGIGWQMRLATAHLLQCLYFQCPKKSSWLWPTNSTMVSCSKILVEGSTKSNRSF